MKKSFCYKIYKLYFNKYEKAGIFYIPAFSYLQVFAGNQKNQLLFWIYFTVIFLTVSLLTSSFGTLIFKTPCSSVASILSISISCGR